MLVVSNGFVPFLRGKVRQPSPCIPGRGLVKRQVATGFFSILFLLTPPPPPSPHPPPPQRFNDNYLLSSDGPIRTARHQHEP